MAAHGTCNWHAWSLVERQFVPALRGGPWYRRWRCVECGERAEEIGGTPPEILKNRTPSHDVDSFRQRLTRPVGPPPLRDPRVES